VPAWPSAAITTATAPVLQNRTGSFIAASCVARRNDAIAA
jgi:hypothetical protein